MAAVGDALAAAVERGAQVLATADPPTDAAGVDKLMKAVRSTALAGRAVLALAADADRQGAGAEGEEGDAEYDDEELDAAGLEALRREVERGYARYDRRPAPPPSGDLGDAGARVEGGPARLGDAGPGRPAPA